MLNQVSDYVKVLGLNKPFNIVLKSKGNKKADAKYWAMTRGGKLDSHLIHVFMGSMYRPLDVLIIHELIHAKQEEAGINETHGPYFQKWADKMGYIFGVEGIYLPDTDV